MTETVIPTPLKAWFLAARPKTLTNSITPILVGTILAYISKGDFWFSLTICALLSAMFIQIGTNLINDSLDFSKGTDTTERLGPRRASQSGWLQPQQVLAAGFACLALAMLAGLPLVYHSGFPLIFLLLISSVLAYLYTGGPYPLSYHGLGEPFVFIFFGLVSTAAIYYIQMGSISIESLIAGSQIGLLSTAVISLNNYRDFYQDQQANKKTLAVRFGICTARKLIALCVIVPYAFNIYWASMGMVYATLLPLIVLPLAMNIVIEIFRNEPSAVINRYFQLAALQHFLFGILLGMGLLLDYA